MTNPVSNGLPVALLPEEFKAESKEDTVPIPLTTLKRKQAKDYRLGPGDVLGVHIDEALGEAGRPPVVHTPEGTGDPAVGYPIPVGDDGTIALPIVDPIYVKGLTISEARGAVVRAYTVTRKILPPGKERVFVTLLKPRRTRVMVVREVATSSAEGNSTGGSPLRGALGRLTSGAPPTGRGAGFEVDLPGNENDLLTALMKTGGMPGEQEAHQVIIYRGKYSGEAIDRDPTPPEDATVRIPLRISPGAALPFRPDDVILEAGDMVVVPARKDEIFYAAGLLPAGEHVLPRDRDLSVVEAIAKIGGPLVNGGFDANNLNGSVINRGMGGPSPSNLAVIRKTPGGKQVVVQVDLDRAMQDRRENLIVQAGDVLILQESRHESTSRYFNSAFGLNIFGRFFNRADGAANATLIGP